MIHPIRNIRAAWAREVASQREYDRMMDRREAQYAEVAAAGFCVKCGAEVARVDRSAEYAWRSRGLGAYCTPCAARIDNAASYPV